MKLLFTLIIMIISQSLFAQDNSSENNKMEIFKDWPGKWVGEGSMQQGGPTKQFTVEETIELKLNGTILTVEGIGSAKDDSGNPKVVHHAFGVLSYDQRNQEYKFRSYLSDGRSADAWFNVKGSKVYQWGFDIPSGKIRYTITVDAAEATWNEIGEYSADGASWYKFFQMNLKKKG